MSTDATADRRAKLERMALRLALDADALVQRGPDAASRVAELDAAADELQRETLALALELGDDDSLIQLARCVLEGLRAECSRLGLPAATESPGYEPGATPGDVFAVAMRQWREAVRRDPRRADEMRFAGRTWRISGSYLEACNCAPSCSRIEAGGRRRRRRSDGPCTGALSWTIAHGYAGDVDLGGLAIVLAFRHDDEPGSAWDWVLYLDDCADAHQRSALHALFTGGLGRRSPIAFPWASEASHRVTVRAVPVTADHRARWPWFDAGDYVSVRLGDPACGQNSATSLIPGHRRAGIEHRADRLRVADAPLAFEFSGRRAFQSTFDYASRDAA